MPALAAELDDKLSKTIQGSLSFLGLINHFLVTRPMDSGFIFSLCRNRNFVWLISFFFLQHISDIFFLSIFYDHFKETKKNYDILIISVFWFFTQWVRNLVVYFAPKLLKWKLCQKNHTYQTLMNLDEKKLNMQLTQSSYILHFYYDYLVDVFSMQIYPSECFLITFESKKTKTKQTSIHKKGFFDVSHYCTLSCKSKWIIYLYYIYIFQTQSCYFLSYYLN